MLFFDTVEKNLQVAIECMNNEQDKFKEVDGIRRVGGDRSARGLSDPCPRQVKGTKQLEMPGSEKDYMGAIEANRAILTDLDLARAGKIAHVDMSGEVDDVIWSWFSHLASHALVSLLSCYGDESGGGASAAETLQAAQTRSDESWTALLAMCPQRVQNAKDDVAKPDDATTKRKLRSAYEKQIGFLRYVVVVVVVVVGA